MEPGFDAYRELGLSPEAVAEPELVRAAFKALAKKYHPDAYPDAAGKAMAEAKMRRLNEAQSLILSGNYTPSAPPTTSTALVQEPASSPPRADAAPAGARSPSGAPRKVPMGPMAVAVGLLLACFALPAMFGRDHLSEAARLEEQGQLKAALAKADQAILEDPRLSEAYLLRARLWVKLEMPERARTDLANARGLLSSAEYERARQTLFPSPTPAPSASPTPRTWKPKP